MMANSDNLLRSIVPDLREHLENLKAQLRDVEAKRDELIGKIQGVEQKLKAIPDGEEAAGRSRPRQPRGANKSRILAWFQEHPSQATGQSEIASEMGIAPSSARVVLDVLEAEKAIEKTPDGRWRKAPEKTSGK